MNRRPLRGLRRRWLRVRTVHGRLLGAGTLVLLALAILRVTGGVAAAGPDGAVGDGAGGAGGAGGGRVGVTVAAADLPAGRVITHSDIVRVSWLPGTVPDGTLPQPEGRVLAAPVRRGEPLTDARVLGTGLLRGLPAGTRAVTVRVADPAGAMLARPGDRVDVLAAADGGAGAAIGLSTNASADVIVENALVLVAPAAGPGAGEDGGQGALGSGMLSSARDVPAAGDRGPDVAGLLVLAVDAAQARRIAAVVGANTLSVALRPSG